LFAITFEWVTSFVWKGYKKPLEIEDIPELPGGDKIESSYKSFSQCYETQKHRSRYGHLLCPLSVVYSCAFNFLFSNYCLDQLFGLFSSNMA